MDEDIVIGPGNDKAAPARQRDYIRNWIAVDGQRRRRCRGGLHLEGANVNNGADDARETIAALVGGDAARNEAIVAGVNRRAVVEQGVGEGGSAVVLEQAEVGSWPVIVLVRPSVSPFSMRSLLPDVLPVAVVLGSWPPLLLAMMVLFNASVRLFKIPPRSGLLDCVATNGDVGDRPRAVIRDATAIGAVSTIADDVAVDGAARDRRRSPMQDARRT